MALPAAAAIWPIVWAFLAATVVPLVLKSAMALGFGVIAYTGITFAIDHGESLILAKFDGLPSDMWALMRIMGIDTGISIIFGCISAAISVRMIAGKVTQTVWSAPKNSPVPGTGTWTP